jgi:hypothetical protein
MQYACRATAHSSDVRGNTVLQIDQILHATRNLLCFQLWV